MSLIKFGLGIFSLLVMSHLRAESFIINNQVMEFKQDPKTKILYHCSSGCLEKLTSRPRPAKKAHAPIFSTSLGSQFCQNLKGKSILGTSISGDGRDFCYFEQENSFFEIDGLTQYLSK